jgi:hypothetical protein
MREFVDTLRTKENLKARRARIAAPTPTPPPTTNLLFLITAKLKFLLVFLMDFVLADGGVCGGRGVGGWGECVCVCVCVDGMHNSRDT